MQIVSVTLLYLLHVITNTWLYITCIIIPVWCHYAPAVLCDVSVVYCLSCSTCLHLLSVLFCLLFIDLTFCCLCRRSLNPPGGLCVWPDKLIQVSLWFQTIVSWSDHRSELYSDWRCWRVIVGPLFITSILNPVIWSLLKIIQMSAVAVSEQQEELLIRFVFSVFILTADQLIPVYLHIDKDDEDEQILSQSCFYIKTDTQGVSWHTLSHTYVLLYLWGHSST